MFRATLLLATAACASLVAAPQAHAAAPHPCERGEQLAVRVGKKTGRCFPSRPTRKWYRVRLVAAYHHERKATNEVLDHSWRFDSSGAVILYRQCTPAGVPLKPSVARILAAVSPQVDCARQGRFLGVSLTEDASFAARGVAVGGAFTASRSGEARYRPFPDVNCDYTWTETTTGSGPLAWPALVATTDQSTAAGGLSITGGTGRQHGPARFTRPGHPCPTPYGDRSIPPVDVPARVGEIYGRELADRFRPVIGGRWGHSRITLSDTVTQSLGGVDKRATFTLTLTRCPDRRGLTPRGC